MHKKLTGHHPADKLSPKTESADITPYSGQCWKDNRGQGVTGASIYRVKFTRDGYSSPCEVPTSRFLRDFTLDGVNVE
jgi:hypothetical protein